MVSWIRFRLRQTELRCRRPEPPSRRRGRLWPTVACVNGPTIANRRAGGARARLAERLRNRLLRREDPSRQFVRYVLVGFVNTTLGFFVYRGLLEIGTPYALAAALAFGVGSVNGYILNRRWTFAASDTTRARIVYVVVQASGAATTSLLVLLFVRAAGTGRIWAYLVAIPPVTVATFAANRVWTFSERG